MKELDNAVHRPVRMADYICDPDVKLRVQESLTAAKKRGRLPGHLLVTGGPGTGKTTLAGIVAAELGVPLIKFVGRELKTAKQLSVLYKVPECGAILFLDEIHAVSKEVAELLYPIMEDGEMSSAGDPEVPVYLNPLMVIGATTEPASLEKPLVDRFITRIHIPAYTEDQMAAIVSGMAAKVVKVPITKGAITKVAGRAKGTPRVAGALLYQVNDSAIANDNRSIDEEVVDRVMSMLGISDEGLDHVDMQILSALDAHGTVGLSTLAILVGQDTDTLSSLYEPYLMRRGYMTRTAKGRKLTDKGKGLVSSA